MSEMYDDTPAKDRDADDSDPVADVKKRFRISEEAWEHNRAALIDDIRFARDEEQWPEAIRRERELDGRPCLTLNQLQTFIHQVVNDARQNKPGIDVHPVGDGADPEVADLFNGLIRHIEQSSDADVAYDTALDFAVTGGFGFFRIGMRYASDDNFDKDLTVERVSDAASVYPDPHSTAADSSDWNIGHILCPISKAAWEKRWADKDPVSFDGEPRKGRETADDEVLQYLEEWTREEATRTIVSLTPIDQGGDPQQVQQANDLAGPSLIVGLDVYEEHKDLFDALGVKVQGQRDVISHKVTQTLWSGAEELERVEWAGSYIPIVPVWGDEVNIEGKRVLRSLVRGAKDAQRMFNYWNTTATEQVALAPKSPYIGKVGTFDTDAAKWASANTVNHAYIEYDGENAPERQQFSGVPAGAIQQAASAQQNIMSIIGIYKSSIGAASNEDSGVAINARDKQADTGSFHFIDNRNRALRHAGRILLDLIPKVYSTPRMLRVLAPDGEASMVPVNQPVPVPGPDGQPQQQVDPLTGELKAITRMLDLTAGKYDLVVKSGPNYATQREQLSATLTEVIRAYPAAAPALTDLIIRNMDLPDADEAVQRLQALGPQNPQLQEAHKVIQGGQQEIMQLRAQVAQLQGKRDGYERENDIRAYDAETDRLKVIVGKDGAPSDPNAMAQVVMASLLTILQSPDILDGMSAGGDPQQLAATLAARMQPQGGGPQGGAPPAAPAVGPPPSAMPPQPMGQAA